MFTEKSTHTAQQLAGFVSSDAEEKQPSLWLAESLLEIAKWQVPACFGSGSQQSSTSSCSMTSVAA